MRNTLSDIALPAGAMLAALLLFGVLVWFAGVSPLDVWLILFKGAFGDWFSWQNTLQRAAPLMLTALCVAIPARAGLVIIGGEGALVLGGLAGAALPYAMPLPGNLAGTVIVCAAGAAAGGLWIALAGWLRQYRGINETISSLLLAYVAIGLFKHFVEGPLRDPASLNKPSTDALAEGLRIGGIAGSDVHWGFILGVVACVGLGLWLRWTPGGFAVRVVGGNPRTAQLVGLPATRLILLACARGRRLCRAGRRRGGGGGAQQRQRLPHRGLRLCRHPGVVHGAAQPAGHHSGGHPVRRLRRRWQPAAAPPGPARCLGAGAAGPCLRADPGQRSPARQGLARLLRQLPEAGCGRRWARAGAGRDGRQDFMSAAATFQRAQRTAWGHKA